MHYERTDRYTRSEGLPVDIFKSDFDVAQIDVTTSPN